MKRNYPLSNQANRTVRCSRFCRFASLGWLGGLLLASQVIAQQTTNESEATPTLGPKRIFPREALRLPSSSERSSSEAEPIVRRAAEERITPIAAIPGATIPDRTSARDQTASQPNNPAAGVPTRPLDQSYKLSENDYITISVYQEPDLETKARIDRDGMIEFPLLGTIRVGGKTVREATAYIRTLLQKDYLVNPQVSLTLVEYAKRQFTILGEVRNPGTYNLPDDRPLTLLQAVGVAGGFAPGAKKDKITVTRRVGRENVSVRVDATAFAQDKNARQFIILPDDQIDVPERFF